MGVIGHFAQPKAMLFDRDVNSLMPEKDSGKPKKLIDYAVVKKGLVESRKHKTAKHEQEEGYLAEEERLAKEKKEQLRLKKLEDQGKKNEQD